MRFTTVLAFASSAAASAIPSRDDCLANHHADLAEYADCGSRAAIATCLASLSSASDLAALEACYSSAGCSDAAAAHEARYALSRCDEMVVYGDLRRRHSAMLTAAADAAMITAPPSLFARSGAQGDDCFTTDYPDTTSCPIEINNGKATTQSCVPAKATVKSCRPGWLCTEDDNGTDVCMEKVDSLDVGGIILAIIFAVAVVSGIAFLTFMSCRESRAQKKAAARAEATALARAATKKKRAEEVRAPLMSQQQQAPYQSEGGVNPFGDSQPH